MPNDNSEHLFASPEGAEVWELANRACCLLHTDQFEEAGERLGKALE